jgi:hypothetical protein
MQRVILTNCGKNRNKIVIVGLGYKSKSTVPVNTPNKNKSPLSTWTRSEFEGLDSSIEEIRSQVAPWLKIGSFQSGLLSHLSTWDILRALSVLKLCSYDFIGSRSMEVRFRGQLHKGITHFTIWHVLMSGLHR